MLDSVFGTLENLRVAVRGSAQAVDPGAEVANDAPDLVAPPWQVVGRVALELAQFPLDAVRPFVPVDLDILQTWPGGTLGLVAFISYESTPVGSYNEIVVAPALVRYREAFSLWIAAIDVDSETSLRNGRFQFGLPKQLRALQYQWLTEGGGRFAVDDPADNEALLRASYTDTPLSDLELPEWLAGVRATLRSLALPLTLDERDLVTYRNSTYQRTRLRFEGTVRPADLRISVSSARLDAYNLLSLRQSLVGLTCDRFVLDLSPPSVLV
jgi:hypothetical protein